MYTVVRLNRRVCIIFTQIAFILLLGYFVCLCIPLIIIGAALKCAPIMEWEFILASGRSSFLFDVQLFFFVIFYD